jgi:hypothetical protein
MLSRTRLVLIAFLVSWLVPVAYAGAQTAPQNTSEKKKELQRVYTTFLTDEGYKPEIDSDGDVRFKHEGKTYFIQVTDTDDEFFRMVLANIWSIDTEAERGQVMVALDYSNARSKVAKAHSVKDNVWVCIEAFVAQPGDFRGVFKRSLSALQNGVAKFVEKMRELQK